MENVSLNLRFCSYRFVDLDYSYTEENKRIRQEKTRFVWL